MLVSHGIHTRHPSSHPFRWVRSPPLSMIFNIRQRWSTFCAIYELSGSSIYWFISSKEHLSRTKFLEQFLKLNRRNGWRTGLMVDSDKNRKCYFYHIVHTMIRQSGVSWTSWAIFNLLPNQELSTSNNGLLCLGQFGNDVVRETKVSLNKRRRSESEPLKTD